MREGTPVLGELLEECSEDTITRQRDGGKRPSRQGGEMGGALPPPRAPPSTPRFILKLAPLRSMPVSFKGGIAHESSAATATNAQVQDNGAPECTASG